MYLAFHRNYGMEVRIARFHNIFGPEGTWRGGREKAAAALCRKVVEAKDRGELEIWGMENKPVPFQLLIEDRQGQTSYSK